MTLNLIDLAPKPHLFIPRDGKDRPMLVPPQGGKPRPFARTSSFVDAVEDKSSLSDWKQRETLYGAMLKPTILDKLRELDPYGTRHGDKEDRDFKRKLDALCEEAMIAAGARQKAEDGSRLHELSELVDAGVPLPETVSLQDRLDLAAYRLVTLEYGITFTSSERFTACPEVGAAGTPDRTCFCPVADPDGNVAQRVWDLKTGTLDYGGLKMACQLAIYAHSQFCDPTVFESPGYAPYVTKKSDPEGFAAWKAWKAWQDTEFEPELAASAYSPIPPVDQKWGVILNLPAGSGEATLHWVDLEIGWEAAEQAVNTRATRSLSGKALRPFASSAA